MNPLLTHKLLIMNKAIIRLQNLRCKGCSNTISKALDGEEGISGVEIDVDKSEIMFSYALESQMKSVLKKLKGLGYPTKGSQNTLSSKLKSINSCVIGRISD